jgi:integral membrane protein (TIGR01906 family)
LEGQVRYADPTRSSVAFFNENEISHMEDVRELLKNIFILFSVSVLLFIILVLLIMLLRRGNSLKKTGLILLWSSSFTLLIFLVFLILSTNFSSLFDNFHVIFFPQGNYMFPEGSLLITMFPFGFFFQFFIRLAISSSALALIMFILGIIFTAYGYRKGK